MVITTKVKKKDFKGIKRIVRKFHELYSNILHNLLKIDKFFKVINYQK